MTSSDTQKKPLLQQQQQPQRPRQQQQQQQEEQQQQQQQQQPEEHQEQQQQQQQQPPPQSEETPKNHGANKSEKTVPWMFWLPSSLLCIVCSLAIGGVTDIVSLFWLGTIVNVVLSCIKLALAQLAAYPKALMADALHGLGDTVAEVVSVIAYSEASRPPDKEHPWGHGKIESIGAVIVTLILLYVSAHMGYESVHAVAALIAEQRKPSCSSTAADKDDEEVSGSSLVAAGESRLVRHAAIAVGLASLLLKEALFRSTLAVGEEEGSSLIVASAWHHRSDAFAAGVALASQWGATRGYRLLDPVGGGLVACMLAHSAVGTLSDTLSDLIDYNAAADEDPESRCGWVLLSSSITTIQGVRNHTLRTRRMGPYCLVDTTIVVDARISASAASVIAEAVHDRVVNDFRPFVTDVVVHVDPENSPQSHRLETHEEGSYTLGHAMSPEELEATVRDSLLSLSDERPELARISEVTELQCYYYGEAVDSVGLAPYVDVKADILLEDRSVTLKAAADVARAARARVLKRLPHIIRDIDLDLELNEEEEEDPSLVEGPACTSPASCSASQLSATATNTAAAASETARRSPPTHSPAPTSLLWSGQSSPPSLLVVERPSSSSSSASLPLSASVLQSSFSSQSPPSPAATATTVPRSRAARAASTLAASWAKQTSALATAAAAGEEKVVVRSVVGGSADADGGGGGYSSSSSSPSGDAAAAAAGGSPLQQVTLIWQRGPESREPMMPYSRRAGGTTWTATFESRRRDASTSATHNNNNNNHEKADSSKLAASISRVLGSDALR